MSFKQITDFIRFIYREVFRIINSKPTREETEEEKSEKKKEKDENRRKEVLRLIGLGELYDAVSYACSEQPLFLNLLPEKYYVKYVESVVHRNYDECRKYGDLVNIENVRVANFICENRNRKNIKIDDFYVKKIKKLYKEKTAIEALREMAYGLTN